MLIIFIKKNLNQLATDQGKKTNLIIIIFFNKIVYYNEWSYNNLLFISTINT